MPKGNLDQYNGLGAYHGPQTLLLIMLLVLYWLYYLEMRIGLQLIHATEFLDGQQCFHQTNVSQGQTGSHQETRTVLL